VTARQGDCRAGRGGDLMPGTPARSGGAVLAGSGVFAIAVVGASLATTVATPAQASTVPLTVTPAIAMPALPVTFTIACGDGVKSATLFGKTIDLNGGPQYPVELLRRWKSDRETPRQAALRGLQSLTEEKLQSLISEAFTEHDTQIKDTLGRLEENDQEAAGVLRELLAELTELRNRGSVLDADLVGQLDSAAQMLGHLQDTAGWLQDASQRLSHLPDTAGWLHDASRNLGHLQDTASALQDASERLGHLQDTAGTLLAGAQALGRIPDLGELASLIDRLESAATSLRNIEGWS